MVGVSLGKVIITATVNKCSASCEVTIVKPSGELTQDVFRQLCINQGKTYRDITEFEIPYGYTSIANSVFSGCYKLVKVIVSDTITSIGDYSFAGERGWSCLNDVEFGENSKLKTIGNYAFRDSSLKNINLPDTVVSIGKFAFSGCESLENIKIGSNIAIISEYMFSGCIYLKNVEIGTDVTSIERYAFRNCLSLSNLKINAIMPPTLGSEVFIDESSFLIPRAELKIYVLPTSLDKYRTSDSWKKYANKIYTISEF